MRDKLIHEYLGVDLEIIWAVIEEDFQPIKPVIKKIALEMQELKNLFHGKHLKKTIYV